MQKHLLLKDINLTIKEGEFVSVMGPSGSGKSTLLNVIGMLDEFNEGEYFFMKNPFINLKKKCVRNYTNSILVLFSRHIILLMNLPYMKILKRHLFIKFKNI